MIDVKEEWAEIRRLHRAEGMGMKAIARRLGVGRAIRTAARLADETPKYGIERQLIGGGEPRAGNRHISAVTPDMPATVVARPRIGWTRGIIVLREKTSAAELGPSFKVKDSVSVARSTSRANCASGTFGTQTGSSPSAWPDGGVAGAGGRGVLLTVDPGTHDRLEGVRRRAWGPYKMNRRARQGGRRSASLTASGPCR